jgi:hypothetical protein
VKFRVPLLVKLGALVLDTTGFYTYVGQMVPQKEVYPPKETLIKGDITTAEMTTIGKEIFEGKGLCTTCHTIGKKTGPFRSRWPTSRCARRRVSGDVRRRLLRADVLRADAFIVPGSAGCRRSTRPRSD